MEEIMRFIFEFHRNGKLSKCIDSDFIVLIVKIESLQCLNHFRLISMVGSLYKVLSKILTNWLWRVVSSVISKTQQLLFMLDILDWILIANELVQDAKRLKKNLFLFKVDFEKAFDLIYWSCLEAVIKKNEFSYLVTEVDDGFLSMDAQ